MVAESLVELADLNDERRADLRRLADLIAAAFIAYYAGESIAPHAKQMHTREQPPGDQWYFLAILGGKLQAAAMDAFHQRVTKRGG